jgi:hypothetical protein
MRWLLLLCASLLLAGCGASDPVASEDVAAAVEKTTSVGSSRVSIAGGAGDGSETAEGEVDYDGRRARMTVRYEPADDGPQQGGQMLFVGPTAYMETSIFGIDPDQVIPELKRKPRRWQSFEWDDGEPSLGELIFPFPYVDPSRLMNAMEEVSGDVESLGKKDVRGVETEGYRLTVDLRRVVEEAPAAHREALLEELERESRKTIPVQVWIDDDGFARRLTIFDPEDEVTLDFYDFGIDVDVEAPPEDQVEPLDLLAGAGYDEEVDSGELEDLEDAPRVSTVTVEEDE